MSTKTKRRLHYCKHCNSAWTEHYLAELCYKVDMDNLVKAKEGMHNGKNKALKKRVA